jgi:hypothetical protein
VAGVSIFTICGCWFSGRGFFLCDLRSSGSTHRKFTLSRFFLIGIDLLACASQFSGQNIAQDPRHIFGKVLAEEIERKITGLDVSMKSATEGRKISVK